MGPVYLISWNHLHFRLCFRKWQGFIFYFCGYYFILYMYHMVFYYSFKMTESEWTSPFLGRCGQCCSHHGSADVSLIHWFLWLHPQEWNCWMLWQFCFLVFEGIAYFFPGTRALISHQYCSKVPFSNILIGICLPFTFFFLNGSSSCWIDKVSHCVFFRCTFPWW